jgi:hypothetical protein
MRRMLPLIGGYMPKPKNEPPLPDYFNATSVGDLWHLHCKRCDAVGRCRRTTNIPATSSRCRTMQGRMTLR